MQNKVAIVTGASRGIGRAIALQLATQGANVVVNYASSAAAAEKVVAEITAAGGEAFALQADVSQADQVDTLLNTVLEKFKRIDILVNNAGITRDTLAFTDEARRLASSHRPKSNWCIFMYKSSQ